MKIKNFYEANISGAYRRNIWRNYTKDKVDALLAFGNFSSSDIYKYKYTSCFDDEKIGFNNLSEAIDFILDRVRGNKKSYPVANFNKYSNYELQEFAEDFGFEKVYIGNEIYKYGPGNINNMRKDKRNVFYIFINSKYYFDFGKILKSMILNEERALLVGKIKINF